MVRLSVVTPSDVHLNNHHYPNHLNNGSNINSIHGYHTNVHQPSTHLQQPSPSTSTTSSSSSSNSPYNSNSSDNGSSNNNVPTTVPTRMLTNHSTLAVAPHIQQQQPLQMPSISHPPSNSYAIHQHTHHPVTAPDISPYHRNGCTDDGGTSNSNCNSGGGGLYIPAYGEFYPTAEHGYYIPTELCPAHHHHHAPFTLHTPDYGPATVPMVSQSGSPPIPMPVQVPPGHVMQQIVDENGTLRHVILSTAHQQIHGQLGVQPHIHGHYITNGTTPHFFGSMPGTATGYPGPPAATGHHYHPMPGPHLQPQPINHSPSPPNSNYHKDERRQKQHTKLLRKWEQKQRDMGSSTLSTPAHSPSPRKCDMNGLRRTSRNGASSVGTSEDGEESSSVPDDEDEIHSITEHLSTIQPPQVSEVTSRSALVKWTELPPPNENLVINAADLRYEVLLSDRGKEGKYKIIFKGPSLSCRIRDLRPGEEYLVCLQVHLDQWHGSASEATSFTTPACEPDTPLPPKLIARTKNSLQLRWNAPLHNGSNIQHYILEYTDGSGTDFVEIAKTKGKQYSMTKLQASSGYSFRLAAINECGKSGYSDTVMYTTMGNPPPQPAPPILQHSTSSTLCLAWGRLTPDEEYVLQMDDKQSGHGFLTAYAGRDTFYECNSLKRASSYFFRLRANNDAGHSQWCPEVSFRTMSERPGHPPKPQLKGRPQAHSFKVKWDPPADRGGAEIRSYTVEVSSGADFHPVYTGAGTECICDRLQPGTTYQVRVMCEGPAGQSGFSDPCTVTTEPVVPGQTPTPFYTTAPGPFAAILRWDRPDNNGGAPVTEYEMEIRGDTNATIHHMALYKTHDTSGVAKDLLPGECYLVQVRAYNRIGAGAWSDKFQFTAGSAPPLTPSPPQISVRSPTHLTVMWMEPHCNGAPISEYRLETAVTDTDESYNISYQGVQTSAEIRNLIPFTTYYFKICASNMAGTSPFSAVSSTRTPAAVPSAPTIYNHEIVETDVILYWNSAECNGSPILYYNIECSDRHISTEKNVLDYCLEDLHPETSYRIKVQAVNEIGAGPYSNPLRITTNPLPPTPPNIECMGVGHNFIKLKWGDGKNVNFTKFYVEMYNPRAKEFQNVYTGTNYSYKVHKLQELTKYQFRICSQTTRAGIGHFSDEYVFETCAALPLSIRAPRIAIASTNHGSTLALGPTYSATITATALTDLTSTSVTLEWQHSKNSFTDDIEYLLQGTKVKEQDYTEIYRGPETRFTVDNLDIGQEYLFRVCPIRIHKFIETDETIDLFGTYSPALRHLAVPCQDIAIANHHPTVSNSLTCVQSPLSRLTIDSVDGGNASNLNSIGGTSGSTTAIVATRNYNGLVQKLMSGKIFSLLSNPQRMTDLQKAIMIGVIFLVIAIGIAAIVRIFIR